MERYNGWPIRQLRLPCGHRIICTFAKDGSEPRESIYESNHNVYRLSPTDEIVWQVRRDDSIRPPDWWETLHRLAREQGLDGKRKPFMYMVLEYPDGKRKTSDGHGDGTDIALWEPGCTIHLYGSGNDYILDPETGIAKNVETGPGRPW
jgi:hypothetical protein